MLASDSRSPELNSGHSLADLVEEFTTRLQQGDSLNAEDYAAAHPDHAHELRRLLPALQVLADLSRSAPGESGATPAMDSTGDPVPGLLGDYRIVREVGRGGMGVVYEAEQISLKRRVALKVLPFASAMDTRRLQRFKNEAQAAAQLHHTNIVPVFGVGCERGVHFYAMQFIEGKTAAELIADMRGASEDPEQMPRPNTATVSAALPTQRSGLGKEYFRKVAQWGIQAAEALEHAHELGVVHRDIKPNNLLVDARGNLWIADFGLAQVHTDGGLTMTGDVIGTLRYMSPEQALGKRWLLHHRTDIYSPGVTLYELLTLQPAFASEDRQLLLQQIAFEEPRPLRAIDRSIPAELETIVLKALGKSPEERYPTAKELADDLRRFTEDKLIRAKRPSFVQRILKWSRRHSGVVATSAFSTILILLLTAAGLVINTRLIRREQQQTQKEKQRAESAFHAEARRRLQSHQAVEEMYGQVIEQWLLRQPRLTEVQQNFLKTALHFYQEFAEEDGDDATARYDKAKAYKRIGNIQRKLQQEAQAEQAYRKGIAILEALAEEDRDEPKYLADLSSLYMNLGFILADSQEASVAHRSARALAEQLVARFPKERSYRAALANTTNNLANVLRPRAEALDLYRRAADLFAKLSGESPNESKYRSNWAISTANVAAMLHGNGDLSGAEKGYLDSLGAQRRLATGSPDDPDRQHDLTMVLFILGELNRDMARAGPAVIYLEEAKAIEEKNTADFPATPAYSEMLANICGDLGELYDATGRTTKSEEAYRRALAAWNAWKVARKESAAPRSSAIVCSRLGNLLWSFGRRLDAKEQFRQALAVWNGLPVIHPPHKDDQGTFTWFLAMCPDPEFRNPARAIDQPGVGKRPSRLLRRDACRRERDLVFRCR